jgi:hypothetical protein
LFVICERIYVFVCPQNLKMMFLEMEAAESKNASEEDLDEFEDDGFVVLDEEDVESPVKVRKRLQKKRKKRCRPISSEDEDEEVDDKAVSISEKKFLTFPVCEGMGKLIRVFQQDDLVVFVAEAVSYRYIVVKGFRGCPLLHCCLNIPLQQIFDYHDGYDVLPNDSSEALSFVTHYA